MTKFCFWSIGDKDYAYVLQTLVDSFHHVGMKQNFFALSDRKIEGVQTEIIKVINKKRFLFKFDFLQSYMKNLDYDFFIFLDADNYFVRKPNIDWESLLEGDPLHVFFESDCTKVVKRKNWWSCPVSEFVNMMRECGVTSEKVYNVNAGFFIIRRTALDLVCELVQDFWQNAARHGYELTEEAPLAYAMHMLCIQPESHLLSKHYDLWCTDWTGHFAHQLPDGKEWIFPDYMSLEEHLVNPAIVHLVHSKDAMIKDAKQHHLSKI